MADLQGNNLQKFVIGIVVVGIILVIGIFISAQFQTQLRDTNTAGTAVNESVTSSPTTGISATLDAAALTSGSCGTITAVYNGTGGVLLGLGNFTQTGCGVVNASSTATFNTTLLFNYPYTYSADNAASNASDDLVTSLSGGTAWITILVVVGFAVIVLGMLTSGLGKAAEGNSNAPTY